VADEREACPHCGLLLEDDGGHVDRDECVQRLRKAMLAQRAAAQRLGTDIALQFLRALEELSLDPDCGFHYAVWDKESKKPYYVERHQVAGVFAAILHKYKALVDFSPMRDLEERRADALALAIEALGVLDQMLELVNSKTLSSEKIIKGLAEALDQAKQLSARLPGLRRS
jgi:hypothetical protein